MTGTMLLNKTAVPGRLTGRFQTSQLAGRATPCSRRSPLKILAKIGDSQKATEEKSSPDSGSFGKIEAPVRDTIPDGSTNVEERDTTGILKSPELNRDKEWFGTEVGFLDGMRFYGAIPEVNNCRLAMLGFFLALFGEATTGRNVFQQVAANPGPTAALFLLITTATTIPVVRGFPRRGNSIFTPDAEVINGRIAMLAFASIVVVTIYKGTYLGIYPFFH